MHVLFDTNVILDVLLHREPWVTKTSALWQANDQRQIIGYITACALTDIFYIARRITNHQKAREAVHICLESFKVCKVDLRTLKYAETLPGNDFEDNLQIACASLTILDGILTRDKTGFKAASMAVMSPDELLERLNNG